MAIRGKEIATLEAAEWVSSFWNYLPNPDVILKEKGKTVAAYRDLLYDPHTAACEQSRKAGVLSLEWRLEYEDGDALAKVIEEQLTKLNIYGIMESMLDAPFLGYAVLEVTWEVVGGYILPRAVIAKPQEWFQFDREQQLRLKTRTNIHDGILLPPNRFLVVQYRPTYTNPYGTGVLSRVWWAAFFKRNVQRFWNTFTEKFGTPHVLLTHDFGNDVTKVEELVSSINEMVQDATIALPSSAKAELVGVTGTANADMYQDFLAFCNAEISKAILGQTLSTETAKTGGSYAATKAHLEVRGEIIESDKRMVSQAVNTLIHWIYTLNTTNKTEAVFTLYESSTIDKVVAERDKILYDTGVRFTPEYLQRVYGLAENDFTLASDTPQVQAPVAPQEKNGDTTTKALPPDEEEKAIQDEAAAEFAAVNGLTMNTVQAGIDTAIDKRDAAEYTRETQDILAPIFAAVDGAGSFEDVKKKS